MTKSRNFRELSRKKKMAGMTMKAWIIFASTNFFALMFAEDAKTMPFLLIFAMLFYVLLFIIERIDEDIFEILAIKFKVHSGGNKFYA